MKIAIIDSGIDKIYEVKRIKISIDRDYKFLYNYGNIYDENNHGTLIYKILREYIDDKDEVFSVKILNKDLKGHSLSIIKGIELAIEEGCEMINLSLGTTSLDYLADIRKVIDYATNRGIIIVSANSNENAISYPASLKNVIGIFNAVNKEFYCDEEMNNLYLQNIQYYKGQKLEGTSYIVPHIVGTICQQIRKSKKISIEEIFKIYLENFRLIK